MRFSYFLQLTLVLLLMTATGCDVLPVRRFRPTLNNPFPQLSEVAVVPFINASGNDLVEGREFAELYANQLQQVPGFNVVPVSTVELAMADLKMSYFHDVEDVRKIAKYLNVDVVVIGTINEFSGYQPPKFALEVEWYARNPYLHPIPAGYSLPWGTPAEKQIPDKLVLEAERDLAKAQLKTQTPEEPEEETFEDHPHSSRFANSDAIKQVQYMEVTEEDHTEVDPYSQKYKKVQDDAFARMAHRAAGHYSRPPASIVRENPPSTTEIEDGIVVKPPYVAEHQEPVEETGEQLVAEASPQPVINIVPGMIPATDSTLSIMPGMPIAPGFIAGEPETFPGLPADWPDPRGLIPDGPESGKPENTSWNNEPILRHIAVYNGNDSEFTRRLQDYESLFVDDRRIGGWQGILRRRTDFISVCCRMHIWEMLSARGGAGKADKVCTEPKNWYNP